MINQCLGETPLAAYFIVVAELLGPPSVSVTVAACGSCRGVSHVQPRDPSGALGMALRWCPSILNESIFKRG